MATSTAEMAAATGPLSPWLRTAWAMVCQLAPMVMAEAPTTTSLSVSSMTRAAAAGAYVYPSPVWLPDWTCTTTRVTTDHFSVPSAWGCSNGIRYATASTRSIVASAAAPVSLVIGRSSEAFKQSGCSSPEALGNDPPGGRIPGDQ